VHLLGGGNEELESPHLQEPIGEDAESYETQYAQKMGDTSWVKAIGGDIRSRTLKDSTLEWVADECISAWEHYEAGEVG